MNERSVLRMKPVMLLAALGVALYYCITLFSVASRAQDEPDFPPQISPYNPHIDPADFVAHIDNPYLPLEPGTTHVYEGESGGELERITVAVTNKTKKIMGVTATVVHDVVTVDGEIVEATFDWYAQDRWGNVWYFGEDSKEYEDGKVVSSHGSWEAGVDGARPGLVMLGEPELKDRYRQEYYAGVAEDMAQILRFDASVDVPYGHFDDVLVTKEWTPLEPKVVENKFYAPGIGMVLERPARGPKEEIGLIEVTD